MSVNYSVKYYDDAKDLAKYLAGKNGSILNGFDAPEHYFEEKFLARTKINVVPVLQVYNKYHKLVSKITYQDDGVNPREDKRHRLTKYVKFGHLLRNAMYKQNSSINELEENTGIACKKISRIFNGDLKSTIAQRMAILEALGMELQFAEIMK